MTAVAITGYASLDHVVMVDGVPSPGRTTAILERPDEAWPRLGGSPAYVAAALAGAGVAASPVSWVGDDAGGEGFRRALADQGIRTDGIAVVPGARTPIAILAYEPQGGCMCLYHPAIPKELGLTDAQRSVVAAADWLCVTIGPVRPTQEALVLLPPDRRLAWVVKDDPRAMPPGLAAALAARADVIFFSAAETDFVGRALAGAPARRPGQLLIETAGGAGARATWNGSTVFVAAEHLTVTDPTGAGDTFAGAALAALAAGEADPAAIIAAGHKAARALLSRRTAKDIESA